MSSQSGSHSSTNGSAPVVMIFALAGMGVLHIVYPKPFDTLIPPELPGRAREWTYGSGVAELAVAGLLAVPQTRRLGGQVATALFIGVFPGNLQMVRAYRSKPVWPYQAIAWARLPLQIPMILGARRIARGGNRGRRLP